MSGFVENQLSLIGNTPLIRLNRVGSEFGVNFYLKAEFLNPGGSVKDRIALEMVRQAERKGLLNAGGTIIEATAGNTGIGLAIVARSRGYRCLFVIPDKMSTEKIELLKAYGAEIVMTVSSVTVDDERYYQRVAERLEGEVPGAFLCRQFENPDNPAAHYKTTGPEIWRDLGGRVDAFVCGVGTGGTISGVGRYLKEKNPRIGIICGDPSGSVLSGGDLTPWKVEGIGEEYYPETLDRHVVDRYWAIPDRESFHMARRLLREEGLLVGGSTGTALAAAFKYAEGAGAGDNIVVMAADTGRNYLSKIFNDQWMRENGVGEM